MNRARESIVRALAALSPEEYRQLQREPPLSLEPPSPDSPWRMQAYGAYLDPQTNCWRVGPIPQKGTE